MRCKSEKIMGDYYSNRGWEAQSGVDAWCKDCVRAYCVDKDSLREYCWYNNRLFSEDAWERAQTAAEYKLTTDKDFIKANRVNKAVTLAKVSCEQFLRTMNLQACYAYSDNISEEGLYREFDSRSLAGTMRPGGDDSRPDDSDRIYSALWNGIYTKRDLELLEAKYEAYVAEYDLETEHLKDAARKNCKHSLILDNIMDAYLRGQATLDDVTKASKLYEEASKNNMFAASKRKPGESAGGTSFSEIAGRLQSTGKIEAVQIKWPKDDVDDMIEEYVKIAAKLKGEGVFT